MKTTFRTPQTRTRNWYEVDANGQVLGRLASRIAIVLMGKHKPEYTPHVDTGDFIVVKNAEKVRVTGLKSKNKVYERASGYHGGLQEIPFETMLERTPEQILRLAVKRMLPKNFRLARHMMKKLKVYAGEAHPHMAQQPKPLPVVVKVKYKAS